MTTIGDRIKIRREELNMTQAELARILGYKSRTSVHKMELGERGLPQKKILQIAEALHTTPEYIMGWGEKPAQEDAPKPTRPHIVKRDGKIILDGSKLAESIAKALERLNEPAQHKVLDYINDLSENKKNVRKFVEQKQKRNK